MRKRIKSCAPVIATFFLVLLVIVAMLFWNFIDKRNNKETIIYPSSTAVSFFIDFGLTNNLPVEIENVNWKSLMLPGNDLYYAACFQTSQTAFDLYVYTLKNDNKQFTLKDFEMVGDTTNAKNMNVLKLAGWDIKLAGWDTHSLTNIILRDVFRVHASGSEFYIYSCGDGPVVDVFIVVRWD